MSGNEIFLTFLLVLIRVAAVVIASCSTSKPVVIEVSNDTAHIIRDSTFSSSLSILLNHTMTVDNTTNDSFDNISILIKDVTIFTNEVVTLSLLANNDTTLKDTAVNISTVLPRLPIMIVLTANGSVSNIHISWVNVTIQTSQFSACSSAENVSVARPWMTISSSNLTVTNVSISMERVTWRNTVVPNSTQHSSLTSPYYDQKVVAYALTDPQQYGGLLWINGMGGVDNVTVVVVNSLFETMIDGLVAITSDGEATNIDVTFKNVSSSVDRFVVTRNNDKLIPQDSSCLFSLSRFKDKYNVRGALGGSHLSNIAVTVANMSIVRCRHLLFGELFPNTSANSDYTSCAVVWDAHIQQMTLCAILMKVDNNAVAVNLSALSVSSAYEMSIECVDNTSFAERKCYPSSSAMFFFISPEANAESYSAYGNVQNVSVVISGPKGGGLVSSFHANLCSQVFALASTVASDIYVVMENFEVVLTAMYDLHPASAVRSNSLFSTGSTTLTNARVRIRNCNCTSIMHSGVWIGGVMTDSINSLPAILSTLVTIQFAVSASLFEILSSTMTSTVTNGTFTKRRQDISDIANALPFGTVNVGLLLTLRSVNTSSDNVVIVVIAAAVESRMVYSTRHDVFDSNIGNIYSFLISQSSHVNVGLGMYCSVRFLVQFVSPLNNGTIVIQDSTLIIHSVEDQSILLNAKPPPTINEITFTNYSGILLMFDPQFYAAQQALKLQEMANRTSTAPFLLSPVPNTVTNTTVTLSNCSLRKIHNDSAATEANPTALAVFFAPPLMSHSKVQISSSTALSTQSLVGKVLDYLPIVGVLSLNDDNISFVNTSVVIVNCMFGSWSTGEQPIVFEQGSLLLLASGNILQAPSLLYHCATSVGPRPAAKNTSAALLYALPNISASNSTIEASGSSFVNFRAMIQVSQSSPTTILAVSQVTLGCNEWISSNFQVGESQLDSWRGRLSPSLIFARDDENAFGWDRSGVVTVKSPSVKNKTFVCGRYRPTTSHTLEVLYVPPDRTVATVASAASAIAGAASSAAAALSGGVAMDIQTAASLSLSLCAPGEQRATSSVSKYLLSPFVDFGWFAVVFGNIAIATLATCAHLAWTFGKTRTERVSWRKALTITRFPSLSISGTLFMATGVSRGTWAQLLGGQLASSDGALHGYRYTPQSIVSSLCGVAFLASAVTGVVMILRRHVLPSMSFKMRRSYPPRCLTVTRCLLYPKGEWRPHRRRRRFGPLVNSVRFDTIRFAIFGQLVCLVVDCVSSIDFRRWDACSVQFTILAGFFAVAFGLTAVRRVGRSLMFDVLNGAAYLVLCTVCVVNAINLYDSTALGAQDLSTWALTLNILLSIVSVLRVLYNIWLQVVVEKDPIANSEAELDDARDYKDSDEDNRNVFIEALKRKKSIEFQLGEFLSSASHGDVNPMRLDNGPETTLLPEDDTNDCAQRVCSAVVANPPKKKVRPPKSAVRSKAAPCGDDANHHSDDECPTKAPPFAEIFHRLEEKENEALLLSPLASLSTSLGASPTRRPRSSSLSIVKHFSFVSDGGRGDGDLPLSPLLLPSSLSASQQREGATTTQQWNEHSLTELIRRDVQGRAYTVAKRPTPPEVKVLLSCAAPPLAWEDTIVRLLLLLELCCEGAVSS